MVGVSYGGYEVFIFVYKMLEKIKCLVSLNGVVDLFCMLWDRKV